ncbi:MAG: DinB family protein [Gemmatimonadales bacterium]|jgi:uncharacterized damage-inducible protein DinB|nr:DinB family protein [Gemmatimonadales bacterium]
MPELQRLADQLERSWQGDAWHGPALGELTQGLSAAQAHRHHLAEAHSIWELVLHCTAWVREVSRRLGGGDPAMPVEGDWPAVGEASEAAWEAARLELRDAVRGLARAVREMDPGLLDRTVGEGRDAPLGTGTTYYVMLHGTVQHNLYHAGQVALLRKLA